ncbi:MAG: TM0996/MTH895 family glutaredoxin-like protein [Bacteroidales bacterium]|nr:TM0996/MTH895 family glutaredoxin-like protein [Bacteroidales bacterium]
MEIKVLGTGCAKCKMLEKVTRETVIEANSSATVTKVEDIIDIMKYGILQTPALVIDGKVVLQGKVPSRAELIQIINN